MSTSKSITVREALFQAMDEEMERDPNVFLLGEEVAQYHGAYKVSKGLWEKYGDQRVLDTPISEAAFTGLGIGAAMLGLRPIVEFMSFNFSFVAFDQIVNNAMKLHYMSGNRFTVPIVFRGPNGAAVGVSCQHSHCVESIYGNLPGCKIVAPATPSDSKGLLKSAIRDNNPVIFLENELLYNNKDNVPEGDHIVPIGKASVVQEGKDVTLISYSRMFYFCQDAVEKVKDDISVELIDLRSIKPFDIGALVRSVRKTKRAIIVEEGHRFAGIGAEVSATILEFCFDYLDAPVLRLHQKETPLPYSTILEQESIPSTDKIVNALKNIVL